MLAWKPRSERETDRNVEATGTKRLHPRAERRRAGPPLPLRRCLSTQRGAKKKKLRKGGKKSGITWPRSSRLYPQTANTRPGRMCGLELHRVANAGLPCHRTPGSGPVLWVRPAALFKGRSHLSRVNTLSFRSYSWFTVTIHRPVSIQPRFNVNKRSKGIQDVY